jgi:hypothetical protein
MNACPRCSGNEVFLLDHLDPGVVNLGSIPVPSGGLQGKVAGLARRVKIEACSACGHVELTVEDPGALYGAWKLAQRKKDQKP